MKENVKLLIDPNAVDAVFVSCLFHEGEAADVAVEVEGIVNKYGFHPARLEAQRAQVTEWLQALPVEFRESGGGGWSFLNACVQANGAQWTGLHQRMEQLFCLGIGLGLAAYLMPRDMWEAFPGGMPYVVVKC